MKNLIVMLVITLTTLSNFGQSVIDDTSKYVNSESTQSKAELVRPEMMRSLQIFVESHFANSVDADSITETIADGKPAVTFSFTDGDRTTESILIDNGDSLSLHTDTFPTKWKEETADIPSAELPREFSTLDINEMFKAGSLRVAVVPTCAGVSSPGNPYPCCNTNKGNCTFYAWHAAKQFWGFSMPTWGGNGASNAMYWYDKSKAMGLPTSRTPGLYAIAVSSTLSPTGHVGFTLELANSMILLFEQNCGSSATGVTQTWHSISKFNKGYVLSPSTAPSPTAFFAHGMLFKSNINQAVKFRVTNVNPGARAVVIFPNGGRATLKDSQLSSVSNGIIRTYMTLSTAGTYSIQFFNENGKYSGVIPFTVN